MATAKRTLWIEARLQDLLSRPLTDVEKRVAKLTTDLAKKGPGGDGGFFGGVLKQLTSVKTAIAGLAAGYVGLQGLQLGRSVAEDAAQIARLAEVTGDSVRNLSELAAAIDVAGGKGEDLTGTMRALQAAARQAASGNVEVLRSFQALGIQLEDLQTLAPSQLFERLAAGLEKYSTAQEKELRLGKLLPEQFQRLLPLIGRGLAEFQQQILAVRRAGATVTEEEGRIAERFDKSLGLLKVSFEGLVRSLVTEFGPELTAVFERLSKLIADNRAGFTAIASTLAGGVAKGIDLVVKGIIELIALIEKLPGVKLVDQAELTRVQQLVDLIDEVQTGKFTKLAKAESGLVDVFLQGYGFTSPGTSGERGFNAIVSEAAKTRQLILDELVPKEGELRAKLADLQGGLAAQLRKLRESLGSDLSSTAATIRGGAAAADSSKAAARSMGLLTPEELAAMQRGYEQLGRTLATLPDGRLSEFETPPNAGVRTEKDAAEERRKQIALLQQMASLAPTFQPLHETLEQLQKEANVFELRQMKVGAENSELLQQAIAHLNEEIAKSKRLVTGGDFSKGFSDGAHKSIQAFTDLQAAGEEAGERLVGGSLQRFSDLIGQSIAGVMKWKDAFKQWAQSVAADLGAVAARLATVAILSAVGLQGGGVVIGGTAPVRAMAGGGVVTGPELLLAGEGQHDEAIVPMPNGAVPVKFVGGGGRGGTVIVNNWSVHTLNGRDAARVLYDNKDTINALQAAAVESQMGWRGRIARASR